MRLPALRRRFGLVLQDVYLFSGSVRDNIRLGHAGIGDADVQGAARSVHADRFVERLPDGFDSEVGERGASLSVGQRQLLSFARALAFAPDVLLLDEATSSVDTETERLVQDALHVLMAGRTTIAIAHRLSTVQDMDQILVFHKGELREAGAHQQLLARRGLYHTLYQLQYRDQERGRGTAGRSHRAGACRTGACGGRRGKTPVRFRSGVVCADAVSRGAGARFQGRSAKCSYPPGNGSSFPSLRSCTSEVLVTTPIGVIGRLPIRRRTCRSRPRNDGGLVKAKLVVFTAGQGGAHRVESRLPRTSPVLPGGSAAPRRRVARRRRSRRRSCGSRRRAPSLRSMQARAARLRPSATPSATRASGRRWRRRHSSGGGSPARSACCSEARPAAAAPTAPLT